LKKSFWKKLDERFIQGNTSEKNQEIKKQRVDPKIFETEEIKNRKHFCYQIGPKIIPKRI